MDESECRNVRVSAADSSVMVLPIRPYPHRRFVPDHPAWSVSAGSYQIGKDAGLHVCARASRAPIASLRGGIWLDVEHTASRERSVLSPAFRDLDIGGYV